MPYADPEKKKQQVKRWREDAIKNGYGKALYRRRAARYRNEEILREGVEDLLRVLAATPEPDWDWFGNELAELLKAAPPVGPPSDFMP